VLPDRRFVFVGVTGLIYWELVITVELFDAFSPWWAVICLVIHAHGLAEEKRPVHVIDGKHGAPPVLVLHEGKAFRLSRMLVAHKVQILNLAPLRENAQHISLCQMKWQASGKHPRGTAIRFVPRRRRSDQPAT
jgi:hypothetical protein